MELSKQGEIHLSILRAIHIGRLLGVDINVHPTFGLIFIWVFFQWGLGENGGWVPFALGSVFVGLVFLSVLLHELGHCAMAQQFGVRVLDITLWPFNGVSRIEKSPGTPRGELLVSLAGPAMNLAIFFALLPILLLVASVIGADALIPDGHLYGRMTFPSLLAYLALTNLFLVIFNLLPAFPMDGGRVLRASLTPSLGRDRATQVAVGIGIGLAIAMLAIAAWERSIFIAIVALFVIGAAHAEGRVVRVESAMRNLRVGQFALWDMGGIAPNRPLTFALRGGPRDIVVTENGYVMGMLWRTRLLDGLQGRPGETTVGQLMDSSIYVADVADSVYDVHQQMSSTNRWAVPVTEDGLYRGIFTADRFVHLYRQIAPGVFSQRLSLPDEWRDAISETLKGRSGKR